MIALTLFIIYIVYLYCICVLLFCMYIYIVTVLFVCCILYVIFLQQGRTAVLIAGRLNNQSILC